MYKQKNLAHEINSPQFKPWLQDNLQARVLWCRHAPFICRRTTCPDTSLSDCTSAAGTFSHPINYSADITEDFILIWWSSGFLNMLLQLGKSGYATSNVHYSPSQQNMSGRIVDNTAQVRTPAVSGTPALQHPASRFTDWIIAHSHTMVCVHANVQRSSKEAIPPLPVDVQFQKLAKVKKFQRLFKRHVH
jgi:hypothetical protein